MQKNNPPTQILIIGGGFAGLNAYTLLQKNNKNNKLNIKLISEKDYFLFTPLLHEIASNNLSHKSIQQQLSDVVNCNDFIKAKIEYINTKDNVIIDSNQTKYNFGYLILATGAITNYFNTIGAKEFTIPLKTLSDAIKISKTLNDLCLQNKQIKIALIGAGPTSIELATEISCYFKKKNFLNGQITIINKGSMPVETFPEFIQAETKNVLEKKHIRVINNCIVSKIEDKKIFTSNNEQIDFDLAIWTAGVTPNYPQFDITLKTDMQNRIITNQYLQLEQANNIYINGDISSIQMPNETKSVPMLAQAAVQEAKITAHNIIQQINQKPLSPFKYESKGLLISLGKYSAAGQIGNIKITGFFAWIIWRTIYLFNFKSWKKRFSIAYEWSINLFE